MKIQNKFNCQIIIDGRRRENVLKNKWFWQHQTKCVRRHFAEEKTFSQGEVLHVEDQLKLFRPTIQHQLLDMYFKLEWQMNHQYMIQTIVTENDEYEYPTFIFILRHFGSGHIMYINCIQPKNDAQAYIYTYYYARAQSQLYKMYHVKMYLPE